MGKDEAFNYLTRKLDEKKAKIEQKTVQDKQKQNASIKKAAQSKELNRML